ncbi:hypothetical protein RI129_002572 [Pyrocoelia pectoralis]|uniref:Uncharacterized protein n=1 Tax=Pyrocoelia pectoralis TaxID=417401 RepID=A0AAN7VFJ7_9COLE
MDTYYLLLDKDSSKVSLGWKVMQLLCLTSIGFSGFWAAFCMGRLSINFGHNCFLFAHLDFLRNDTDDATIRRMYPTVEELPSVTAINLYTSKWGSRSVCYFCQFTPLMSSIYALIWFILFVLCTKGGVGHISDIFSRPWRIVYPALLFGAFSAVFMFVSAIQLNNGSQVFCAQFVKILNKTRCFNDIDKYGAYFSVQAPHFLTTLIACIASSNICCISWIIYVVILGLRIVCAADFQLISIEVVTRKMSKHGLTLIPTSETKPHQMMATPESMSDDIEKQTGKSDQYFPLKDWDSDHTTKKQDPTQLQSEKQKKHSPSLNYVDDSPFSDDKKTLSLVQLKTKSHDLLSKENDDDRAPRVDFTNL